MRPARIPAALLLSFLTCALLPSTRASAQSYCDFAPRLTITQPHAAVGVPEIIEVAVTDPNGDAVASLVANTSALPAGNDAQFTTSADNTAGTLTWTPQVGQTGNWPVTFTVTANSLTSSQQVVIPVVDTAGAPFVQCPSNLSTLPFNTISFHVTAGDPDGEAIVSLIAQPLPTGAVFTVNATNTAGTFAWTPNGTQAGSFNINFVASSSTSASYSTAITVTQSDRPPFVLAPPSASGTEGIPLSICVAASDPDGDLITSLSASPLPSGATFTSGPSNLTGTLSWTPATGQAGSYTIFFVASNSLSGSVPVPVTIHPGDRAPVITAPAARTVAVGSSLSFNVTASDPDSDPIASLTASNLPAGATFLPNVDNTVGTFGWTPVSGQGGTWFVLFQATANNVTSSATTAINVTGEELAARIFTTGGNGTIHLGSGKGTWCTHVEPVGGDFNIGDVVPTSIVMISPGTGAVSQIAAIAGKGITLGDADKNTIADFEVCFSKNDLRQLFSLVSGRASEIVAIRGDLANGSRFQGSMTIDVVGQGGPNGVAILPNPPNPGATLRFTTSQPGAILARVFDIRGRLVRTLEVGGDRAAGDHALRFDGLGDSGKPLPTGIYLFRVETADGILTTKAAILR